MSTAAVPSYDRVAHNRVVAVCANRECQRLIRANDTAVWLRIPEPAKGSHTVAYCEACRVVADQHARQLVPTVARVATHGPLCDCGMCEEGGPVRCADNRGTIYSAAVVFAAIAVGAAIVACALIF